MKPGEFYFNIADNGILEGEFTNRNVYGFGTEISVPVALESSTTDSLVGTYQSTWIDADTGEPDSSQLVIDLELDCDGHIKSSRRYYLKWTDSVSSVTRFHGYGFVFGKVLIGHYRGGCP